MDTIQRCLFIVSICSSLSLCASYQNSVSLVNQNQNASVIRHKCQSSDGLNRKNPTLKRVKQQSCEEIHISRFRNGKENTVNYQK